MRPPKLLTLLEKAAEWGLDRTPGWVKYGIIYLLVLAILVVPFVLGFVLGRGLP